MRHPVLAALLAAVIAACSADTPVAPRDQTRPQFDHATADGSVPDFFVADDGLCILKADHTIKCAGNFQSGMPAIPTDNDFVELAISYFGHVLCGLHASGELTCVGSTVPALMTPPRGPFTAVTMNVSTGCAIRPDQTVACWGENGSYSPPGTYTKIRGGWAGFCGIHPDQTLGCWANPAALVVPTGTFTDISVGATNCGLRTDGTVTCFDIDGTTSAPLPGTFTRIVSNDYTHVLNLCGQKADMTLTCIGPDFHPPATPFGGLSAGVKGLCGQTQGQLACWGEDYRRSNKFGITDAPTIITGEPYRVNQGEAATLNASASTDPNGDPLTFEWDIGANGTIDATTAAFTLPVLSTSTNFILYVSDGISRISRRGNIIVTDLPPSATLVAPARVNVGTTFTLKLTNVTDPSPTDLATARGVFDCGDGRLVNQAIGVFTVQCTAPASPATLNVRAQVLEILPLRGAVRSATYTASIVVSNNAPPQATLSAPTSVSEGSDIALSLTNPVDENTATLTYAFDCGTGYGAFAATASATCATTDDGSRAVRAKVRDDAGLEAEYATAVTVTNVSPDVNAFAGATILVGETYTANGSFSGAAVDQFTAAVDYGAGAQTLTLNGFSFSLSHSFVTAGTYNVTVAVTDDDGSTSSRNATVVVQSPAQAAETLTNTINTLVSSGVLSAGTANAMTSTLSTASSSYASGNVTAGNNQIDAFINKVQAQLNSGRLTAAQGQALIDYANRIKNSAH